MHFLVNVLSGPRLTMPGVTAWADGFRQAVNSGAGHYPGRTPLRGHCRERNEQLGQDVAETRRERQGFSVPRGFAMEEEKTFEKQPGRVNVRHARCARCFPSRTRTRISQCSRCAACHARRCGPIDCRDFRATGPTWCPRLKFELWFRSRRYPCWR